MATIFFDCNAMQYTYNFLSVWSWYYTIFVLFCVKPLSQLRLLSRSIYVDNVAVRLTRKVWKEVNITTGQVTRAAAMWK